MQKLKNKVAIALASIASFMLAFAAPAAAATITVGDLNADGWSKFQRDSGTIELSEDFGAPEGFGNSSVRIDTPLSNDKAYVGRPAEEGGLLSDLTNISYYTYRDSSSTAVAGQAPALNVSVDVNGQAEGGFTTLVFEPIYQTGGAGAVQSDVWQLWDAGDTTKWWSTNPISGAPNRDTFVTLESIKAANPDAVILGYAINQGGGNAGLIGASDGLTINDTTYDFELANYVEGKDDCKNGGWEAGLADGTKFKNQGDCVSHFASNGKAKGNPVVNFFRSLFR